MRDYLKFYIDGQWVDPVKPKTLDVTNPATEAPAGRISMGSAADVDRAVKAARAAFASYSQTSVAERVSLLERVVAEYKKRYADMAAAITEEMGAPVALANKAQAAMGLAHLQTALAVLKDFKFQDPRGSTLVVKEPIGVCAFITPWNWPVNQIACKVAPALAVGCTMVLKPSEIAPFSAHVWTEILDAAGVPAGVFNLVNGDGPTVGAALSSHPEVDMVSFTGSTRAGIEVARNAAPTVKRVHQELGGKSPNIILPDADLKAAVAAGVVGVMGNSGQSCNAPTRMLVPHSRMDEALAIAKEAANATTVGDPASGASLGVCAAENKLEHESCEPRGMPTSYQPYSPDQDLLLPQSLQEWLPAGHLAHYISDTIDALDLSAFFKRYEDGGSRNQPFHPGMMVKVLVYGYATGVFSSRKIARKLHEDVAFRVLAAGNFPKHRTLCDFRALHLNELAALFVQVVKLAQECGLVKLGTIAIDGTKLKANASKHKAMSYERMQSAEIDLKAQIDALLKQAVRTDLAEADEPELDIPQEIARREKRLLAIQAAKLRIEARQREADLQRGRSPDDDSGGPDGGSPKKGSRFKRAFGEPQPKAQDNFTDPDSRIMKTSAGFEQCFNAQTGVDAHRQIIVAAELTQCAADSGELPGMLEAVVRNTGDNPKVALADAGYRSEEVLAQVSELPTEVIVAMGREGKTQVIVHPEKLPHTVAMAATLDSAEGKAKYRRRKAIVEPPNGWIKHVLGFRQFSLRGVDKVRCEFKLVCAALNLRRMATMMA